MQAYIIIPQKCNIIIHLFLVITKMKMNKIKNMYLMIY